jgi:hypothetical protein
MPTTVIHSIGSGGRDYSGIQSWFDATPSDLTVSNTLEIGELYNDSTFNLGTSAISCSGKTTDATRYHILRPHSGEGFNTNPNKATNALTYNPSNGVAIRSQSQYVYQFSFDQANMFIEGIQFKTEYGFGIYGGVYVGSGAQVNACIMYSDDASTQYSVAASSLATNCLVIEHTNSSTTWAVRADTNTGPIKFCTVITFSGSSCASHAIFTNYGSPACVDNAAFGYSLNSSTDISYSARATYEDYNFSDTVGNSGCGTHGSNSLVASSQFVAFGSDYSTSDFRLLSTAGLIGVANPVSGITTDILGNTRDATHPAAGCVEPISSATHYRGMYLAPY